MKASKAGLIAPSITTVRENKYLSNFLENKMAIPVLEFYNNLKIPSQQHRVRFFLTFKEKIPPEYVAWRVGTTTLFLLGS
jgi:hypothetical protein